MRELDFFQTKTYRTLLSVLDKVVSLFVFIVILVLLIFTAKQIWELVVGFTHVSTEEILYSITFVVIFVKSYRMLLMYMLRHHIPVQYIVEIAIIAPVIEIIFAPDNRPFSINILFAVLSIIMLLIYLIFSDRLHKQLELCQREEDACDNMLKKSNK